MLPGVKMNKNYKWLPDLVCLEHFGGDWESYLEIIYSYFKADFLGSPPKYNNSIVAIKNGLSENKEIGFWHLVSEGESEENRQINFRRCERIRWPRPIIENCNCNPLLVWEKEHKNRSRICILFKEEKYIVVLENRTTFFLLITAYYIEFNRRINNLIAEFNQYILDKKNDAAV